jgi:hypothetical protein
VRPVRKGLGCQPSILAALCLWARTQYLKCITPRRFKTTTKKKKKKSPALNVCFWDKSVLALYCVLIAGTDGLRESEERNT